MVAGEASSLAWLYVNGSETSGEGLTDGDLVFSDGLIEEGIYEARFFEDDSYTILAKATFTVGDIGPQPGLFLRALLRAALVLQR